MELKKVIIESLLTLLLIAILIFLIFNLMSYFKEKSENFQVISSNNLNVSRAYLNDNQLIIVVTNNGNEEISGIIIKSFSKKGQAFSSEFDYKIAGFQSKSLTISPSPFGAINNYKLIQVISKSNLTIFENNAEESYIVHKNSNTINPINSLPGFISESEINNSFNSKKVCSKWGDCINDSQKRSCINADFIGKKEETRDCSSKDFGGESFHDVPIKKDCNPEFECTEWSPCKDYYNLEDITDKNILLNGYRERICNDKNNCFYEKIEKEPCETSNTFLTKTSEDDTIKNIEVMSFYDEKKDEILNLTLDKLGKSLDLDIVFNEIPENDLKNNLPSISIYGRRISYSLLIIFISALIFITFLIIRFYKKVLLVLSMTNPK